MQAPSDRSGVRSAMADAARVLSDNDIEDLMYAIRIERKPKSVRHRFAQDIRDAVAAYLQHKN